MSPYRAPALSLRGARDRCCAGRASAGEGASCFLALLLALPVLAHAPCWWDGRLLGPGDGAALHFPLRRPVWEA